MIFVTVFHVQLMDRKRCCYRYKTAQTSERNFWNPNICSAVKATCRWLRSMFMSTTSSLRSGYRYHFLSIQNWISNSFSSHFLRMYPYTHQTNFILSIAIIDAILFCFFLQLFPAVAIGCCRIVETKTEIRHV